MANKKKKSVTKNRRGRKDCTVAEEEGCQEDSEEACGRQGVQAGLEEKARQEAARKPVKKAAPKVSPPSASAKKIVAEQDVAHASP